MYFVEVGAIFCPVEDFFVLFYALTLFVHFSYLFFSSFIYLLVALGLPSQSQVDFSNGLFSSCVIRATLVVSMGRAVVASLVVEHRL